MTELAELERAVTEGEITSLVAYTAPQVFALVAEESDHSDAEVIAWGMRIEDKIEVVSTDHRFRMSASSIGVVRQWFARKDGTLHVVWVEANDASIAGPSS